MACFEAVCVYLHEAVTICLTLTTLQLQLCLRSIKHFLDVCIFNPVKLTEIIIDTKHLKYTATDISSAVELMSYLKDAFICYIGLESLAILPIHSLEHEIPCHIAAWMTTK